MDNTLLMIIVGLATAVIGGYLVARESEAQEPIRAGLPAKIGHFIACAGMSGIPAALLVALAVTLFTPDNLLDEFVSYALLSLGVVIIGLLACAALEAASDGHNVHVG